MKETKEETTGEPKIELGKGKGLVVAYLYILGVVFASGLLTVAFGYRDAFVLGMVVGTGLVGGYLLYRLKKGKKIKKPLGKVKRVIRNILFAVVAVSSVFIVIDHIRISVMVAVVQQEADSYTTINRCRLMADEKVCMHESKDKVRLYHFTNGTITDVEDITDSIKKYTDDK